MAFLLAFRILMHDKGRLLTALTGIGIAVLLMLVQLGFRNAIFDSSVQMVDAFDADIIIQNKNKNVTLVADSFPRERLYQARAIRGVESAHAIWMTKVNWKNAATGKEHPIRIIGIQPDEPVWANRELAALTPLLRTSDTALVDRKSRHEYGNLEPGPAQLGRRSIEVVGNFTMGTDFTTDGTAVTSTDTYVSITQKEENQIEFVLVKAAPGVAPESLLEPLRASMPRDVLIVTKEGMRERDSAYWNKASPIGIVMGMGMLLGFFAGVGIVYQILFAQVADHLKEFATLRAVGWSGPSIASIVLFQAILLSVFGFIPSLGIGAGIYELVARTSGLPMRVTVDRAGMVLALTAFMCLFAGLFAIRRLLEADPAELFS
jgi:putative ABC transport system permease protein